MHRKNAQYISIRVKIRFEIYMIYTMKCRLFAIKKTKLNETNQKRNNQKKNYIHLTENFVDTKIGII